MSSEHQIASAHVPAKTSNVISKAKADAPSSSPPSPAAVVAVAAPAPSKVAAASSPVVSATPVSAAVPVAVVAAAGSNVEVKQAMGLKRCDYCTKFCYDGEGQLLEGKLYHVSYCLPKATALIKFANEEIELKQAPKKTSAPIDPIINEIIKTEEAYIRGKPTKREFVFVVDSCFADLGLILEHFVTPCKEGNIVSEEDLKIVFCNMEKLKKLHETVIVGLHAEAKKPPKIQNWGLVFKTYEASFRAEYQVYTKNQSKARARRLALEQEEKFKGWTFCLFVESFHFLFLCSHAGFRFLVQDFETSGDSPV